MVECDNAMGALYSGVTTGLETNSNARTWLAVL
jgi:hypothetical protein